MKTMTVEMAMKTVQDVAEAIRNDETALVGTTSLGDVIRQGDVYLVCIKKLPAKKKPIQERQLAPGTTQGSRHVLKGEVRIYDCDKAELSALIKQANPKADVHVELIGPAFETVGEVEVDHPEHGNRVLPPGEVFVTVYQRMFAEKIRRQAD